MRKIIIFLLFLGIAFAGFSKGNSEIESKDNKRKNNELADSGNQKKIEVFNIKNDYAEIIVPKKSELGDFISVKFKSKKEIKNAWISFINQNNVAIQTLRAFPVDNQNKEWIAIAGIATWWQPDLWQIKIKMIDDDSVFEVIKPFIIEKKEFEKLTINMGKKNTGIVYTKNKKTQETKAKQRDRFAEILKTKNRSAKLCNENFIKPFNFTRISSGFAQKRIYKYTNGKSSTSSHWGVDYPAPTGTVIIAPSSGKVVLSENRVVTGNTLVLEHLPGVYTIYYHLHKIYAKEGAFLNQGTPMAEIGSTGFSTGPHLHWELRINQIPVDPRYLLQKTFY